LCIANIILNNYYILDSIEYKVPILTVLFSSSTKDALVLQ